MISIVIPFIVGFLGYAFLKVVRDRSHRLEVQGLRAELEKTKSVGDRLLVAHEELTKDGLTPERVVEAIRRDPTLLTPALVLEALQGDQERLQQAVRAALADEPDLFEGLLDVDALLQERGVTHDWHRVGDRQIKVPKDKGKGFSHYALVTDMCRRCRMEHQYFRDGGHPSIDDREGFYLGGQKVEIEDNKTPTCLVLETGSVKAA